MDAGCRARKGEIGDNGDEGWLGGLRALVVESTMAGIVRFWRM